MGSKMNEACFVVGRLIPSLNETTRPCRYNPQRQAVCMGRRSDKIKTRKEKTTLARTKIFARIGKQITIAAKQGGADPDTNKALAEAVDAAKAASFPKDTMERAIARATNKDQADYKESSFEVYGHGGCGIYIDVLTDNTNRAAADIRTVVNKQKMKVGAPGSVAFNFERMGVVRVLAENVEDADELLMAAMEGDAEECDLDPFDPEQYRVLSHMEGLQNTRDALKGAGYAIESAHLEMIPKATMEVSERDAEKNFVAIELLEELDDVDAVATNMSNT